MKKAVIGLGANIGEPARMLMLAIDALEEVPGIHVSRCSSVYRTGPVGGVPQPDFLNCVAEVELSLTPQTLLGVCLGIEAALGRRRLVKNGPRCIDLDLLGYEGAAFDTPELVLPHPRINERLFVTVPLLELYPEGNAPGISFFEDKRLRDRVEYWGSLGQTKQEPED